MKKVLGLISLIALLPTVAMAEGAAGGTSSGVFAIGASVAIGMAALGGTLAQGKAVSAGLDSIGRNPSAQGKLFVPMLIGLAFVESLVIIAFVIASKLATGAVG